jgi:PKHD-type hydroxylase
MLLTLHQVLNADELCQARSRLAQAAWADGRATAGTQSMAVKHNRQLPSQGEDAQALRTLVLAALNRHAGFFSAALPKKILPPLFNRYAAPEGEGAGLGDHYGAHVDGAVLHGGGLRVRADLSCTLFLSEPADYDGGELVLHADQGPQRIRLAAGDALLYSGGQLHEVTPVTRGARLASFFWVESLVRGEAERRLLFDLDRQVQGLRARLGDGPETVALAGTYHNLLRLWADT